MKLTQPQRDKLADLFFDLAKIILATLVFGPFLTSENETARIPILVVGLLGVLLTVAAGLTISQKLKDT